MDLGDIPDKVSDTGKIGCWEMLEHQETSNMALTKYACTDVVGLKF